VLRYSNKVQYMINRPASWSNALIRQILIQSFKIIISGFLIGFLLHRIGIHRVTAHLGTANIYWLIAAIFLFITSHFGGSFQWKLLLSSEGIQIPWQKIVSFYFVGLFFNNFLISGLGGDFFRMGDVRRYSKNGTGAVSTVFLDRFAGLFVLSGMSVLTAPWVLIRKESPSYLEISLAILVMGWIFVLFFLFNKQFARPFAWLLKKIIPEGITAKVREVYQRIHNFGRNKKLIFKVIMISLIIQSARIMTHYLLGRSLGVNISPLYFFLIIPIVAIMASLPISLGGVGIREQSGVVLFGVVGMSALQAFSMEFLAYLVAIVSSLPGGVVFILRRKVETPAVKLRVKNKLK